MPFVLSLHLLSSFITCSVRASVHIKSKVDSSCLTLSSCTLFFETEIPIQSVAETVSSWDPPQHQPCHYRHVPQHPALCLDAWVLNSCAMLSRRYGLQGTTFPALRYILCLHFPLVTWTLQYVPFVYQSLNPSAH